MVYVDIPGLPKDFNVKYRPPRVSLFPPSYRDRAFLRSIHRDVLRQAASLKKDLDKKDAVAEVTAEGEPKQVTTAIQTAESHCYHVCPSHPHEEKETKKTKKHKKTRVVKSCCCKEKIEECDTDESDDDSNDSNESDEEDCKSNHCKHKKKKCIKKKSHKCGRKDESNSQIPDSVRSFLPYPLSSPSANIFWGRNVYQQPFVEGSPIRKEDLPGWNLDYKLDAARRADEKYLWNLLAQREGNNQQTAFQWLAERDSQRQAALAKAANDLAGLSFDPKFDRTPLAFPYFQPPAANYGDCRRISNHEQSSPFNQPANHKCGQHYNMNNWVKPHDNFDHRPRGHHDFREQSNQQDFTRHETSGRQWHPYRGKNTGKQALNENYVYPQGDRFHKAGYHETARHDQWTDNDNGGFSKDNKKWSPGLNANAQLDNGQQTSGGFGGQNVDGDVPQRNYQIFQDNYPAAEAIEAWRSEKDRSGSIVW